MRQTDGQTRDVPGRKCPMVSATLPRLTFSTMAASRPLSTRLPPTTLRPRMDADEGLLDPPPERPPPPPPGPPPPPPPPAAAAMFLVRIIRPIILVPSLFGCHVTGCCWCCGGCDPSNDTKEVPSSRRPNFPHPETFPKSKRRTTSNEPRHCASGLSTNIYIASATTTTTTTTRWGKLKRTAEAPSERDFCFRVLGAAAAGECPENLIAADDGSD